MAFGVCYRSTWSHVKDVMAARWFHVTGLAEAERLCAVSPSSNYFLEVTSPGWTPMSWRTKASQVDFCYGRCTLRDLIEETANETT